MHVGSRDQHCSYLFVIHSNKVIRLTSNGGHVLAHHHHHHMALPLILRLIVLRGSALGV